MFAMGTDNFVVAGILPDVAASLHTSVGLAGLMVTFYALTYAMAAPVMAALTGNWPRKLLLISALGIFVVGNAVSALAADLQERHRYAVKLIPVERDKEARLYVHQAKFEAGLVRFPQYATWLRDLEDELLAFPVGKADDQVDSISQALAYKKSGYDATLSWVG